jgi:3-isopropylmalate dehydrogenase
MRPMNLVVMPGDGIGPEIVASAVQVLELVDERLGLGLSFERHDVGFAALEREGSTFPAHVLERCSAAD